MPVPEPVPVPETVPLPIPEPVPAALQEPTEGENNDATQLLAASAA